MSWAEKSVPKKLSWILTRIGVHTHTDAHTRVCALWFKQKSAWRWHFNALPQHWPALIPPPSPHLYCCMFHLSVPGNAGCLGAGYSLIQPSGGATPHQWASSLGYVAVLTRPCFCHIFARRLLINFMYTCSWLLAYLCFYPCMCVCACVWYMHFVWFWFNQVEAQRANKPQCAYALLCVFVCALGRYSFFYFRACFLCFISVKLRSTWF